MSRGPRTSRSPVAVLAVGALLAPTLGLAEETGGAESPEAVYARVVEAADNEDIGAMFACLAPQERAETTMMIVAMTGFMVGMAGMGAQMGGEMSEAFVDDGSAEAAERLAAQKAEAEAQVTAMTERWEAVLDRHGLKDMMAEPGAEQSGSATEALAGVDQAALVNDLMAFLQDFGNEETGGDASPIAAPIGELEDLVVDGDAATARVGEEDVRFVRVDGRWYLSTGGLEELD